MDWASCRASEGASALGDSGPVGAEGDLCGVEVVALEGGLGTCGGAGGAEQVEGQGEERGFQEEPRRAEPPARALNEAGEEERQRERGERLG